MLQDLDFGQLDNQYREKTPAPEDTVVCIRGKDILIARDGQDRLTLPAWEQAQQWSKNWTDWGIGTFRYAFRMQDVNYFLYMGEADSPEDSAFSYEPAATLRQTKDGETKMSLRAVPGYDAAAVCAEFGGGGHKGAAGASTHLGLEEAAKAVKEVMLNQG